MKATGQQPVGLVGIGYEGQTLEGFIACLYEVGVSSLVDVRLNAVSRKRGFSKRALGEALARAGIRYEHRPELGNPRENRDGFGQPGLGLAAARATFEARLNNQDAAAAIADLTRAADSARIAVLCYEADDERCHRQVVIEAVERRRTTAQGSRRQAR